MNAFDYAMRVVFKHEGLDTGPGGLPNDPGGRTKYGWSLRQMKADGWDVDGDGDVDEDDVAALTPELAKARYRVKYWDPVCGDKVGAVNCDVATKLVDIAIHAGQGRAVMVLQRALNQVGRIRIQADGKMGPMTIAAVGAAPSTPLLVAMVTQQSALYGAIIQSNPQMEQYRKNWLNRASWPFNSKKAA